MLFLVTVKEIEDKEFPNLQFLQISYSYIVFFFYYNHFSFNQIRITLDCLIRFKLYSTNDYFDKFVM